MLYYYIKKLWKNIFLKCQNPCDPLTKLPLYDKNDKFLTNVLSTNTEFCYIKSRECSSLENVENHQASEKDTEVEVTSLDLPVDRNWHEWC